MESIAVAAAFVAAGSGTMAVVGFLLPFSLGPLVGIAIGVSVDNTNAWVVLVLFALVAGVYSAHMKRLVLYGILDLQSHGCQDRVQHSPSA